MDFESGAGLLHRLTSYTPGRDWDVPADDPRVLQDLVSNDLATLPPQVKGYDLPRVALTRDLPNPAVAATAALAGATVPRQPLNADQLARVLFLCSGVVRKRVRNGETMLFRAAGSAGGRFPLEVYVSAKGIHGVEDGVHWYDPVEHALVQIGPAAGGDATTVIVTGVPWRTGWRYAERGFRHLYWDAGTVTAQLLAAADSAGWEPRLRTTFPDVAVTQLVGADGTDEFPLLLVTLGDATPAIVPTSTAERGELPPKEIPLITSAQRAGDGQELGDPWPRSPALQGIPDSRSLDEVVLQRGSQRKMDRSKTVPKQTLAWSMTAALRGIDVPHWVAVHGVEGVTSGVYVWPDLDTPLVAGDLRDELTRLALNQSLAGEAAYVAISAVEPATVDDRGYRAAQLAAGIVEGRLHLAAYALGATATGMTFLDSDVPALLQQPADLVTLLFTCVGVGEYASRPGGGPGDPVEFTPVMSRTLS